MSCTDIGPLRDNWNSLVWSGRTQDPAPPGIINSIFSRNQVPPEIFIRTFNQKSSCFTVSNVSGDWGVGRYLGIG